MMIGFPVSVSNEDLKLSESREVQSLDTVPVLGWARVLVQRPDLVCVKLAPTLREQYQTSHAISVLAPP
jgi:hypothetical protein